MDDLVVERVLRAVEAVPRGRVVSYGDVGALVGMGPRQVGSIMRVWGGNVAWWRVTTASGEVPEHLRGQAAEHWAAEGIRWAPSRRGCRMAVHRADLAAWAVAYEERNRTLPTPD